MMLNILVVDDEENIVDVLKAYLEKEGYRVFTAYGGKEALDILNKERIDFIVLDLMLPDISGEQVCKKIRVRSQIPILMLTAKAEESDRVSGLSLGADDYMVKPFSPRELVARVKAILRRLDREQTIKADIIEFNDGKLLIDKEKMQVKNNNILVDLTPTEYKLLLVLAQNPGKVFTREELIEKVLGYDYEGFDRTIDAHIKNIRHKLQDYENELITTVYGVGYKFMENR